MPRTRNVGRGQWDAASAQRPARISSAAKKENDSEKENVGRATRASTRRGTALGGAAPLAVQPTATKGKGKGREKPPGKGSKTKTEKLPLQDVTSRYLPPFATTNRGCDPQEVPEDVAPEAVEPVESPSVPSESAPVRRADRPRRSTRRTAPAAAAATAYPSSLPPSSPPSVSSLAPAPQPQLQSHQDETEPSDLPHLPPSPPLPNLSRRLFTHVQSTQEDKPYDAWNEFDRILMEKKDSDPSRPPQRTSDPFGFFALEEKLEAERAADDKNDDHFDTTIIEDSDDNDAGEILARDTSSPRPVRRLKHKYVIEAVVEGDSEDDGRQPPTPQKTVDRTRYSYGAAVQVDDAQLYSPQASSCPSSPSPSKPRALLVISPLGKRKAASLELFDDDNEEEAEEEEEGQSSDGATKIPGRKQAKVDEAEPTRRQLRSRSKREEAEPTRRQLRSRSKREEASTSTSVMEKKTRKPRSTKGKAKKDKKDNDDDSMEQWERERQKRLEYFKELEAYDYETENVYVV